jgi:CRP-like cAMP-binding protein
MGESEKVTFDPVSFFTTTRSGIHKALYAKNRLVFAQGDPADAVFYIQHGRLKVTVLSAMGKEAVVTMLGAGDFCGEGCLAGQAMRMASVSAIVDCAVIRIEKAAMFRLMNEEPAISEMFLKHLLVRNIRAESDLVDQLFNSSEKRLARLLLILANYGKEGKPEPIIPLISQETLAEMIGATRARVNFFMNKFRHLGFIDYNGHLKVNSSLMSVILNDQQKSDE